MKNVDDIQWDIRGSLERCVEKLSAPERRALALTLDVASRNIVEQLKTRIDRNFRVELAKFLQSLVGTLTEFTSGDVGLDDLHIQRKGNSLIHFLAANLIMSIRDANSASQTWLAEAGSKIIDSCLNSDDSNSELALSLVLYPLRFLPGRESFYYGPSNWLTEGEFQSLLQDANDRFLSVGTRYEGVEYAEPSESVYSHYSTRGKPRNYLQTVFPSLFIEPQLRLVYLRYSKSTDQLAWHVDKPHRIALNSLVCLAHSGANPQSIVQLRYSSQHVRAINLGERDCLVFKADAVPHSRSRLAEGELLTLASFGYRVCKPARLQLS